MGILTSNLFSRPPFFSRINDQNLHYHKINLTEAYLAFVINLCKIINQLFNQFSIKSGNHPQGAPHKPVQ